MNVRRGLRREDGAAAVEFALIAGVLFMLLFGMLQFGLAFFQLQNLRAAAREGARAAAVGATVAEAQSRTINASVGALTGTNGVLVEYSADSGGSWAGGQTCPDIDAQETGSMVRVRIDIDQTNAGLQNIFTVDIPLMPTIDLTNATISGQFRCEGVG